MEPGIPLIVPVLAGKVSPMTTSPQTAMLPPMTIPFSERLSETWLLERTYHAQLWGGKELSVPDLTLAMKQLNDFDAPLSWHSSKSKLAERLPLKKSTHFYVPISTWREIPQAEAQATYCQGIPVLLSSEYIWEHPKGASIIWGANTNMRASISGNALAHPEPVSGTDCAVCYLDLQRGAFSNAMWKAWFASDPTTRSPVPAASTAWNFSDLAWMRGIPGRGGSMSGVLPIERSGFLCGGCDQHFNSSQKFVQFDRNTHASHLALCNLLVMGR